MKKPIEDDKKQKCIALRRDGLSTLLIAKEIGISISSVRNILIGAGEDATHKLLADRKLNKWKEIFSKPQIAIEGMKIKDFAKVYNCSASTINKYVKLATGKTFRNWRNLGIVL
jgi:transposase